MQETIVSLATAELAKRAGFTEPVLKAYDGADMVCSHCTSVFEPLNYNTPGGNYCSAPTLSFLRQWLQETDLAQLFVEKILPTQFIYEHNDKRVKIEGYTYDYTLGTEWYVPGRFTLVDKITPRFATYDEALEAGLQRVLNLLIENQK